MHHIGPYPSPRGVLAMFPKDPHRLWVLSVDIVHHMSIVWASEIEGVNISEAGRGFFALGVVCTCGAFGSWLACDVGIFVEI